MGEKEWAEYIADLLRQRVTLRGRRLEVETEFHLPYRTDVEHYFTEGSDAKEERTPAIRHHGYNTDVAVLEYTSANTLVPRVILEAKFKKLHTHDGIVYSDKARAHKSLHPYMRYGMILGAPTKPGLPNRLFRHGLDFDFLMAFKNAKASTEEIDKLVALVKRQLKASKYIESMLNQARGGERFSYFEKQLVLE